MTTYPDIAVDVNVPDHLLTFYRCHGTFAVFFNLLGIFLIWKNRRIVPQYKMMMINMQVMSLIADAQNTLLMQPVYLFPVFAGYTNGAWWYLFRISSHIQMGIFLLVLYLQVASIVCAIVTKYQVVASIGNTTHRPQVFWTFVGFYHSCAFLIFGVFCFANLSRQQEEQLVRTKFPNAMNIFSIENVEVYDLELNKWMAVATILIVLMLLSSIIISLVFSVALFRTLRSKRLVISARNYKSHQIAVTSLMAQAAIPFVIIVIPIGTIVYFFIQVVPCSQEISNSMMAIYSLHSTLSTAVMILSTPQYRLLLRKGFKNSTGVPTPQMTRILPAGPMGRAKKLSEPAI